MNKEMFLEEENLLDKNNTKNNFINMKKINLNFFNCKKKKATEHDNWVYLESYSWTASISFNLTDHNITGGQPWGFLSTKNIKKREDLNLPFFICSN